MRKCWTDALKEWKIKIYESIDTHILFYYRNTHLLSPQNLNLLFIIQDFHTKYVLVSADKAENNVVVVWRLYYVNTIKRELIIDLHTEGFFEWEVCFRYAWLSYSPEVWCQSLRKPRQGSYVIWVTKTP